MADDYAYVGDIIEHLCREIFGKFAIPHNDVRAFKHNVEVLRGQGERQAVFTFRFMTKDFMLVTVRVDMNELFRKGREHIQSMTARLVDEIEQAQASRQQEFRLVLNANPGAEGTH